MTVSEPVSVLLSNVGPAFAPTLTAALGHRPAPAAICNEREGAIGGPAGTLDDVPARDPHDVLGVEPGAGPDEIKAAWRALARRHHPDLTADDPESSRKATRRMAEINAAYASLTRAGETPESRRRDPDAGPRPRRPGPRQGRHPGPPPPPEMPPVKARLDTSATFVVLNQRTTPMGTRQPLGGQAPHERDRNAPDLRASQPSGPLERDIDPDYVVPGTPSLDDALDTLLDFGKFHGHSLGQVLAFEPSYLDWLAETYNRDPEISAAARVLVAELDRRGIRRQERPMRPGWQTSPFR